MVLLILAALWAVVLVPPLVRARNERAVDTIGDFHHRLGVLGRSRPGGRPPEPLRPARTPAPVHSGRHRAPAPGSERAEAMARRRRDVLSILAATAVVTLAIAAVSGGVVWAVQLVADLALAAYVGLWAYYRHEARVREATLHYLPRPVVRSAPTSELMLRRTAGS